MIMLHICWNSVYIFDMVSMVKNIVNKFAQPPTNYATQIAPHTDLLQCAIWIAEGADQKDVWVRQKEDKSERGRF